MTVKKEYFKINEAAARLGVHPNTIRKRIKDGSLAASKIGRDWRISEAAIKDFMKPQNNALSKSRREP